MVEEERTQDPVQNTPPESKSAPIPSGINLDDLGAQLPKVEVGGKKYPLRMANVLGMKESAQAQKLGTQFLRIGKDMENEENQADDVKMEVLLGEMGDAIDAFLLIVLRDMPSDVRDGLKDEQKMAVMSFFAEQGVLQRSSLQATLGRALQQSRTGAASPGKSN